MNKSKGYSNRQAMQRKMAKEIHVADVVEVLEYYPDDLTVDVKPMVMAVNEEKLVPRPPILKVPVAMLGGKEFFLRPWYSPGDIGVIVYLDYDSDNVLESGKEAGPPTTGCHTGNDAVFIGGAICGGGRMQGLPEETIAVGAGGNYMAFGKDGITVHGKMDMEGELTVRGKAVKLVE